jgi:hypothetical protein
MFCCLDALWHEHWLQKKEPEEILESSFENRYEREVCGDGWAWYLILKMDYFYFYVTWDLYGSQ